MDVYEASKQIITKREQEKINAMNNASAEEHMNAFDEEKPAVSYFR